MLIAVRLFRPVKHDSGVFSTLGFDAELPCGLALESDAPWDRRTELGRMSFTVYYGRRCDGRMVWAALVRRYGNDPGTLATLTPWVLLGSELPIVGFTALDWMRQGNRFRVHYDTSATSHLGPRRFPSTATLRSTAAVALRNLLLAYWIPSWILLRVAKALQIHPYDTNEPTVGRVACETIGIAVTADVLFYWLHRLMHTRRFYRPMHKIHHEFKYSIALAHHWMDLKESVLFALPQALPPLVYWGVSGRKVHLLSMWAAFCFTQLNAILGHAGYHVPGLPRWVPFFQAAFHDHHHVDYSVNFAAMFPLTDRLFGTYLRAPLQPH